MIHNGDALARRVAPLFLESSHMIRHYAGLAIDCDSEDCDETYTDSVTMTLDGVRKFFEA